MAKHSLAKVVPAALALLMLTACGGGGQAKSTKSPKPKPTVAATAYPLFDAAAFVAAGRFEVEEVRPEGAFSDDPVTDEERELLEASTVVISPGRRTQGPFDELVGARGEAHLGALEALGRERGDADEIASRGAHVWLDPITFARVVDAIVAKFTLLDPAGEQVFENRAFEYRRRLAALDWRQAHSLASCRRTDLVAENADFAPFANRYGLNLSVTNVVDPSKGGDEPDTLGIDELRERGVVTTTVFTDRLPTSRRAAQIVEGHQVRIAVLDSVSELSPTARKSGADFDKIMKLNLDALKTALDCRFEADKSSV